MVKPSIIAREFSKHEIEFFLRQLVPECPDDFSLIEYEYLFGGLSTTTIRVKIGNLNTTYVLKIFYPNDAPLTTFQNAMNVCHYIHEKHPEIRISHPVFDSTVRVIEGFPCVLMNFISDAVAGDVAVEQMGIPRSKVLYAVGIVLAQLHSVAVSENCAIESYHAGGAVELYKHQMGGFLDKIQSLGNAEFSEWYASELSSWPELFTKNFHTGIVHGDPFMDNVMVYSDGSLAGLVDFEDACIGPVVFDIGSAIAGSCFVNEEQIDWESVSALLQGYIQTRPLLSEEKQNLFDFIAVALLCNCAFRFITHHGGANSNAFRDLYEKLRYLRKNERPIRQKLDLIV